MIKFLFERLIDPLGLPIEAWKEYLILAAIGEIAYVFAYYIVGSLYKSKDINSRSSGRIFHWPIRLACFVIMWAITYSIVWLIQNKEVAYLITVSVLLVVSIICLLARVIINNVGERKNVAR